MQLISDSDRAFFRDNGYLVVRGVVDPADCRRVIDAIWDFLGKDPDDRDGWYTPPAGMDQYMKNQGGGWAEMFHHPSLMHNRQHPQLYRAFAELLDEEKLWCSYDKVACKFPYREGYEELSGSFLHWDLDTTQLEVPAEGRLDRPDGLQGLLMLSDTDETMGGFQCVPENYRHLEQWLREAPADRNGKRLPEGEEPWQPHVVKVTGQAGDLVIWDRLLLHGNGVNRSDRVRFAQFITMKPARRRSEMNEWEAKKLEKNVRGWAAHDGVTLDPRQYELRTLEGRAPLTPLGRKLIGVESWFEGEADHPAGAASPPTVAAAD